MRHPITLLWTAGLTVASLTLGGCSSDLPSNSSANGAQAVQPELSSAAKDQMLERLGRGLAQALKDPAVRTWVSNEIAASPYVEYRIPIRDKVVNEGNRSEVSAIARAASLSNADVAQLLQFPQLELYMPLEDQRASWHGGVNVQVAVRRPTEDYTVYQLDGSTRIVSADNIPSTPTLVLAVSEIDFTDRDGGVRGGRNTGDGMLTPASMTQPAAGPAFSVRFASFSAVTQWTRAFSQYIIVRHDGGLAGDDEMEIFGDIGGAFTECRRYTGLKQGVQYFRNFANLIAGLSEAVALGVGNVHVDVWEDDDTACVKKPADDYYGTKLIFSDPNDPVEDHHWRLCFPNNLPEFRDGDAKIGLTAYVSGQTDPNPKFFSDPFLQTCQ